jgi:hypothetical protein
VMHGLMGRIAALSAPALRPITKELGALTRAYRCSLLDRPQASASSS